MLRLSRNEKRIDPTKEPRRFVSFLTRGGERGVTVVTRGERKRRERGGPADEEGAFAIM